MLCRQCYQPEMQLDIHTGSRYPYQPGESVVSLQCSRCTQRSLIKRDKKEKEKEEDEGIEIPHEIIVSEVNKCVDSKEYEVNEDPKE